MLIRFVVSNFLSFDEEQEFIMTAGNLKTHRSHVYKLGKLNVLKAAAIYGANGAGKSNLIKAIDLLSNLIRDGEIDNSINSEKFKLNPANKEMPVNLELEFFSSGRTYAYGLSLEGMTVVEEWLVETDPEKEDKLIFERGLNKQLKPTLKIADKYLKSKKQHYLIELMEENLLKANELLVSKSDILKIPEIEVLKEWNSNLSVIFPSSKFKQLVHSFAISNPFKTFSNELMQTLDTGIRELDMDEINFERFLSFMDEEQKSKLLDGISDGDSAALVESPFGHVLVSNSEGKHKVQKVVSRHIGKDGKPVSFDLDEESDGTQRLLDFVPAVSNTLNFETVTIVDEIDQSLHPVLLKALITKIMEDSSTKGQFIFSTHESNLLDLDLFRQDEIWFVEKNKNTGGSCLYSLLNFKPRHDLDIKKGYLKGRFGAVPFLANLDDLNWSKDYA